MTIEILQIKSSHFLVFVFVGLLLIYIGSGVLSFAQEAPQVTFESIGAKGLSNFVSPYAMIEINGPVKLPKTGQVDLNESTVTLPLYHGLIKGNFSKAMLNIWYILTEINDKPTADSLGVNWSPELTGAVSRGSRVATLENDTSLTFDKGVIDFNPSQTALPSELVNAFSTKIPTLGSVGDKDYSPLVRIENAKRNVVYNAPIVAAAVDASKISFCNGNPDYKLVHDQVLEICPGAGKIPGTVTLKLSKVFISERSVLSLNLDSTDPVVSSLKGTTFLTCGSCNASLR